MLYRASALAVVVAGLMGCGFTPTYKFDAIESSPTLVFTSDYPLYTVLHVNSKEPANHICRNFEPAGYVLKEDSLIFQNKPSERVVLRAKEGAPISVSAYTIITATANSKTVCGPIAARFRPESAQTYKLHFARNRASCELLVTTGDGTAVPAEMLPPPCR